MHIGLVGATNVGKSTLFNRLIGQFRAIVTDIAGTTTDILRHPYHIPELGNVVFLDSPGLSDFSEEWPYIQYIIDYSNCIMLVIDDSVGITSKEQYIIDYILKQAKKKNVLLIVNKLDKNWKKNEYDAAIAQYYSLGFPNIVGVSAEKEYNIDAVQDAIIAFAKSHKLHKKNPEALPTIKHLPIAIVGKPNAGKSTLLNTFAGEILSKVEDKAGTTRDYIQTQFMYDGKPYEFFDTAGIKRKGHMRGIEKIAYTKTKEMLTYIRPIVLFMIDATEGITHRDMTLIKEVYNIALPMIICLNKRDRLDVKTQKFILRQTQAKMDFAKYIPIMPLTATTGEGIPDIMQMVQKVSKQTYQRVDTNKLNKAIMQDMITKPPRFPKNKICKVLYVTQVDVNAPTFIFFVNYVDRANFAFKKRCENTVRRHFAFVATPIVIRFKERSRKEMDFNK